MRRRHPAGRLSHAEGLWKSSNPTLGIITYLLSGIHKLGCVYAIWIFKSKHSQFCIYIQIRFTLMRSRKMFSFWRARCMDIKHSCHASQGLAEFICRASNWWLLTWLQDWLINWPSLGKWSKVEDPWPTMMSNQIGIYFVLTKKKKYRD